jgi:ribonuclease HI
LSKVIIYTKGVSSGNSKEGIGGWAAIMLYGEHKKEITGGIQNATNNVSEMTAIINALSLLKDPCEVDVFTDSEFVVKAINKNWLYNWEKNSWKKSDGKAVVNQELWEKIAGLIKVHTVNFNWLKENNDHNKSCEELAKKEVDKIKNSLPQTNSNSQTTKSNNANEDQKKQMTSKEFAAKYHNAALDSANSIFNSVIKEYNLDKPELLTIGDIVSSINNFKNEFINQLNTKKVS